jgi:ankyrin repeat protein
MDNRAIQLISFSKLAAIMHTFLNHFAIVSIFALALSVPAFCGEIHDAAKAGDLAKVKALLKDNPKLVSRKDSHYDYTPLHYAAQAGHKDMAELLLANKADVNAKDKFGMTPLHDATVRGHKEVAELLLAKRAQVNARDMDNWTPLHFAASNGHKDVAELLLSNGARINAKDVKGRTPLSLAVGTHHEDVVELLRRHGGHE